MDIGAGTFVVSSAITSNYARRKSFYTTKLTNNSTNTYSFFHKIFLLWQKFIVLFLGIGRMIFIKYLNYQEHTSEYGTHWNFFVTLFFIWLITDFIHIFCIFMKWNENYFLLFISICCICIYQYFLISTPLTNYIFSSPRTTFLSHNREGIFSLLGDIPLYLLTEWYSHNIFFNPSSSSSSSSSSPSSPSSSNDSPSLISRIQHLLIQKQFIQLFITTIFLFFCYYFSSIYIQPPSRRLMNLSFLSVILLISIINIFVLYIIDFMINTINFGNTNTLPNSPLQSIHNNSNNNNNNINNNNNNQSCYQNLPTKTLYQFNDHQLFIFLIANILTGITNMMFQTIYMSILPSLLILIVYMTILVMISWYIKTK